MCDKPLYFNRKSGGLKHHHEPRARLHGRRVDRRVDARLTTKSISQHPADIRNESSVPELSLDHAARALCYTWRSGGKLRGLGHDARAGQRKDGHPQRV